LICIVNSGASVQSRAKRTSKIAPGGVAALCKTGKERARERESEKEKERGGERERERTHVSAGHVKREEGGGVASGREGRGGEKGRQ